MQLISTSTRARSGACLCFFFLQLAVSFRRPGPERTQAPVGDRQHIGPQRKSPRPRSGTNLFPGCLTACGTKATASQSDTDTAVGNKKNSENAFVKPIRKERVCGSDGVCEKRNSAYPCLYNYRAPYLFSTPPTPAAKSLRTNKTNSSNKSPHTRKWEPPPQQLTAEGAFFLLAVSTCHSRKIFTKTIILQQANEKVSFVTMAMASECRYHRLGISISTLVLFNKTTVGDKQLNLPRGHLCIHFSPLPAHKVIWDHRSAATPGEKLFGRKKTPRVLLFFFPPPFFRSYEAAMTTWPVDDEYIRTHDLARKSWIMYRYWNLVPTRIHAEWKWTRKRVPCAIQPAL